MARAHTQTVSGSAHVHSQISHSRARWPGRGNASYPRHRNEHENIAATPCCALANIRAVYAEKIAPMYTYVKWPPPGMQQVACTNGSRVTLQEKVRTAGEGGRATNVLHLSGDGQRLKHPAGRAASRFQRSVLHCSAAPSSSFDSPGCLMTTPARLRWHCDRAMQRITSPHLGNHAGTCQLGEASQWSGIRKDIYSAERAPHVCPTFHSIAFLPPPPPRFPLTGLHERQPANGGP